MNNYIIQLNYIIFIQNFISKISVIDTLFISIWSKKGIFFKCLLE